MKKTIMLWLFAIVSIVSFAQNTTEHLKFMGIPINGTITQFQSKLLAKGCTLNRVSNTLPIGCRAFRGNFIGNKVEIYVYYDEKTKTVYRTKAVISGTSEDLADQKYNEFKDMLIKKYDDELGFQQSDKQSFSILVISKNQNYDPDSTYSASTHSYKGEIDLYVTKDDTYARYPYWYNVHIDYIDAKNKEKHDNQSLEDL